METPGILEVVLGVPRYFGTFQRATTMTPSLMTGTCRGATTEAHPSARLATPHDEVALDACTAVHVMPMPSHAIPTRPWFIIRTYDLQTSFQRQVMNCWSLRVPNGIGWRQRKTRQSSTVDGAFSYWELADGHKVAYTPPISVASYHEYIPRFTAPSMDSLPYVPEG